MTYAKTGFKATIALLGILTLAAGQVMADHAVGEQATLFKSINDDMEEVDMADMIDGKPLVLVVSSAS